MAELETEPIVEANNLTEVELIEHTNKVLVSTEDLLHRINSQEVFENFEQGCRPLVRGGKKRQVYYVEVQPEGGKRVRVEVYQL